MFTSPAAPPRRRPLPEGTGRRVLVAAVASLVAEILIVGTGAAVRLTGSGLGCPTWPRCTADSFTTTPEMGVHGVIEFGNRLLTFALVAVAVLTLAAVWRMRKRRRDLWWPALVQLLSIPAQAVLGGITVWTGLNPWTVAAHLLISLALVVVMTVFLHRVRTGPGERVLAVPAPLAALGVAIAPVTAVVVLLGILTTGSGPHAGDAASARNGLDATVLVGVHETSAWVLFALTAALVVWSTARRLPLQRPATLLLTVEALQIAVGVTQVALDWNAGVVIVHVFLAACLTAAAANVVVHLRRPVADVFEERPERIEA
ncbi:COX15/CtaA family protein [Amnibacterium endophyticum]|uniref:Heme A synthase n=1 Tax=Amnibacterium endophyticum TaxID=2109337 RepID=A0ABW4LF25_9MICO